MRGLAADRTGCDQCCDVDINCLLRARRVGPAAVSGRVFAPELIPRRLLCQWPHFHATNFRKRLKVLLNCDCNNTNMVEAPFKVDGEVVAALRNAVRDCSDRGLAYASKW